MVWSNDKDQFQNRTSRSLLLLLHKHHFHFLANLEYFFHQQSAPSLLINKKKGKTLNRKGKDRKVNQEIVAWMVGGGEEREAGVTSDALVGGDR